MSTFTVDVKGMHIYQPIGLPSYIIYYCMQFKVHCRFWSQGPGRGFVQCYDFCEIDIQIFFYPPNNSEHAHIIAEFACWSRCLFNYSRFDYITRVFHFTTRREYPTVRLSVNKWINLLHFSRIGRGFSCVHCVGFILLVWKKRINRLHDKTTKKEFMTRFVIPLEWRRTTKVEEVVKWWVDNAASLFNLHTYSHCQGHFIQLMCAVLCYMPFFWHKMKRHNLHTIRNRGLIAHIREIN